MVGCVIFGVLLKMEKILALMVRLPLPPGSPPMSGKGSPPHGWVGLKQGLLWLPEGELVRWVGCVT